jgi:hypothetical protein
MDIEMDPDPKPFSKHDPITQNIKINSQINQEVVIGRFISAGSANGSSVYMGPKGGVYYYTQAGNNKRFLNERQKASNIIFLTR